METHFENFNPHGFMCAVSQTTRRDGGRMKLTCYDNEEIVLESGADGMAVTSDKVWPFVRWRLRAKRDLHRPISNVTCTPLRPFFSSIINQERSSKQKQLGSLLVSRGRFNEQHMSVWKLWTLAFPEWPFQSTQLLAMQMQCRLLLSGKFPLTQDRYSLGI